ncbi:MAG: BatA domain-containing protein [candidate division KSB1 bacterium]|nr:BatA domain-containing protein [candidate division KSB1 bacterium]
MDFLNPTFLSLTAAAAAVPILIHLLKRNKAVKVEFAAMRFLLGTSKPIVRWLRLKQLLILLMRIAAVVLLGLAFARPFFPDKASLGIWSDAQREVAIILDGTASLAAADHLQKARSHLDNVINHLEPGTLVTAYLINGQPGFITEREPFTAELGRRIKSALQPDYSTGQLRSALQAVDDVLAGSPVLKKQIYIISDFQTTAWPDEQTRLTLNSRAQIELRLTAKERWNNLAVISAKLPNGNDRTWACSIRNFSGKTQRSVRVQLVINGRTRASRTLTLGPNDVEVVRFKNVPTPAGLVQGYFEVRGGGDEFEPDNRYYFIQQRRSNINVLAINGEPGDRAGDELFFVRRALTIAGAPFSLAVRRASRVRAKSIAAFDVIILANVRGLSHAVLGAIREFVESGGGLILAPGDRVQPKIFNRLFGGISLATLRKPAYAQVDRVRADGLMLTQPEHPVLKPFLKTGSEPLNSSYFYQHWLMQPAPGALVLARFNDNAPAMLAGQIGQGKVIMLAFPLDAEWSDLPIKSAYLPLLYSMCEFAAREQVAERAFTAGQPIYLGNRFISARPIEVQLPDGQKRQLPAGEPIFSDTPMPGVYRFQQGGLLRAFAVNVDSKESQTELIPRDKFLALIDVGTQVTSIDSGNRLDDFSARETEQQQKLWRLALGAAFLLLIGETLLANRTPR